MRASKDDTPGLPQNDSIESEHALICDGWRSRVSFRRDIGFANDAAVADEPEARPIPIPPDLPPVYGDEGAYQVPYCSPQIAKENQDVPRLLPKWPFIAIAFSYPAPPRVAPVQPRLS